MRPRVSVLFCSFLVSLSPFPILAGCGQSAPPSPSLRTPPLDPPAFTTSVSGRGRMVVFIPDLQAPGAVWDTTIEHLGGRVEAHVVDVAGFAGNAPTTGPLMPKLRDGLARYLRERHARDAIVVGHMFGGAMAFWLAMTEPDLVGGVVAVDAPPSMGNGAADADTEEHRRALLMADSEKFARMTKRRMETSVLDPERANWLVERAVRSSPRAIADAFYDMATRDLRPQIGTIRAPVLVLRTTGNIPRDDLLEAERYYRDQLAPIANHELVMVEGAKHYVMFDAPETFFAHLDRFLARGPQRVAP
ncbi:alpha/beta fold hydrolase [Pendulispora albinea]|uniref:Alpha/beta hydrolase n=1 Tax=Pendulispora albinea TaxID=2741071 RepID=A0ABZ2LZD4_9BACT